MTGTIKQQSINVDWKNYDSVIDFYENNLLYFNNFNAITNKDSIIEMIEVKISYCNSLIGKKRYKKALPTYTHLDILLQKIKDDKELFEKYSSRSLYLEGVTKGYLRNYDESYEIFKKLIKEDPENDLYKEWYLDSKANLISKQSFIFMYIGLGIIILDIIGGLAIDYKMDHRLVLIGIIMLLGGGYFPKIWKYWLKYKEKLN